MSSKEKSAFSHFFKEDAETVQDIIYGDSSSQVTQKVGTATKEVYPIIKAPKEVKQVDFKAHWRELRSFFRNANNDKGFSEDLKPALMAPLYTQNMVGSDFPVWVADENYKGEGAFCRALKDILNERLDKLESEEQDPHILKENVERIIHIANEILSDKKPHLSQPTTTQVLNKLEKQLEISGDEVQPFNSALRHLRQSLPENGVLLPYTSNTSLQLLEAAMAATRGRARKALLYDIKQLICRLRDMLRVDREKGPERKNPDSLQDSMKFADNMMKFEELSALLPDSGSEIMSEERKERIKAVLKILEERNDILDQQCYVFVDELLYNSKKINWENLLGTSNITVYGNGEGVNAISEAFNSHISEWTELFKAKRIGELEFENGYQPEVHDDFFEHFKWQTYSQAELNTCPYFILIADDVHLFETEFSALSAMLSSNIPVKVVGVKRDEDVDHNQYGSANKMTGWHANTELGALMLSYKNIYIAQATSITPKYLFDRFKEGLSAFAPAFFYLLNVDRSLHEDSYLWTSASVESRDFPGFTYRGLLGTSWGNRFEVKNNPQPNEPWPVHKITVLNPKREKVEMIIPFTFTDYAVLNPAYKHHFKHVDASYWNEDLIPLTEFMENTNAENIGKVPYIWMMNASNQMQKVAVSWPMVLATQERLDFWHFLQENSGINNYHVSKAVEETKAAMLVEREKEIAQLKSLHDSEIQQVRNDEAGKVMENLTSVLLDLDTSHIVQTGGTAVPMAPSPSESSVKETANEPDPGKGEEKEEEVELSNDPYIETSLCTSCNECTDLNNSLFKYNDDKLAYIADPKAGTFSDLVEAAENCPVAIIHPGSPLNPEEPNLDELIKRAAKFN